MNDNMIVKSFTYTRVLAYRMENGAIVETVVDVPGAHTIERVTPKAKKILGDSNVIVSRCEQFHKRYGMSLEDFMKLAHELEN